jgi:hypothetical protein
MNEATVSCAGRFMDARVERRTELLAKIVDERLASGAGDLSLRPSPRGWAAAHGC